MASASNEQQGERSGRKTGTRAALKKPEDRRAFQQALIEWFEREGRDLPWRRTRDPYAVMVSEFMLQQTQVTAVLGYYRRWLERFPDVGALAAAPQEEVLRVWEGLGYYARARNLHRAARAIRDEHGGVFPRGVEAMAALPGIGRYTAGAIVSFAYDLPAPIVDANIARVLARLLDLRIPIDTAPGQRVLWAAAESLLPERDARRYNSAIMELGATLCRAGMPRCLLCPVVRFCAGAPRGPEALPIKKAKKVLTTLAEDCAWSVRDGRLLLEQGTGTRWQGLWKLPLLASLPGPAPEASIASGAPLLRVDYPFTRYQVTLSVYPAPAPLGVTAPLRWWALEELEAVAMAAPHRRVVQRLLAEV